MIYTKFDKTENMIKKYKIIENFISVTFQIFMNLVFKKINFLFQIY